ncbi:MAG: UDP binding domain-containing protein, partial [Pseudomonadota bacterium]
AYVGSRMIKAMLQSRIQSNGARVLILGLTFKENCPDLRNTRVVDVVAELRDYGVVVDVHDPWADDAEALAEYGLTLTSFPKNGTYDGVILTVAHDIYQKTGSQGIRKLIRNQKVFYDLKSVFSVDESDLRL